VLVCIIKSKGALKMKTESYKVGGEVVSCNCKWACIEEIDRQAEILFCLDEDGGYVEVPYSQVVSYTKP
jgi:hypothetical protein